MNPLLRRLATLRWKVRLLDAWIGVCALLGTIVGLGWLAGLVDYSSHLPNFLRAVALVGILISAGAVAFQYLLRPCLRSTDDLSLALRIEDKFPELNDSLASTVQFLKQSRTETARVGVSPTLIERTVQQTLAKADACDIGRILDRRGGLLFGAAALVVLTAAGLTVTMNRASAATAFWRLVEPFGPHTWTRITVARLAPQRMLEEEHWEPLSPDPRKGDRIAIGRPYRIKVDLDGQIPKNALLEIEGQLIRSSKTFDLIGEKGAGGKAKPITSFVTAIDMTQHYQKFKFRVVANDGSFPARAGSWHEVDVVPPPKLVDLDGHPSPQIAIYPPAYSDLPAPQRLLPGTRHLEVWAGTNVVLTAKADRPLQEAWIEYIPEKAEQVPVAMLGLIGQTAPLPAAAQAALSSAVWGRVPAQLDNEGSVLTIRFMPWISGRYSLHLRDRDRLVSQEEADLRVQLDPIPLVKMVQPGVSVTAHPKADVSFRFRVTDEVFAARSVYIEYRRKLPDGRDVDAKPRRVELFQADDFGRKLPEFLAQASRMPSAGLTLRPRYKQLDFDVVWPLRNENFKDGDLVAVQVCADDFCDIYPDREPGKSHTVMLRIISPRQITQEATGELADIQKQVKNLENLQKKALDTTKETRNTDKIDEKKTEEFIDNDEQTQRRIQDMIGRTSEEGLRSDLQKIRQNLKDNQLTDTPAYRDATKIKGTLDAMAKQELPQLEPQLADIRNDLTQNEKKQTATKKKLDQAGRLQGDVLNSLKELNKELDPSARIEEQRAKLRELIDRQKNLEKQLEDLKKLKQASEDAVKDDKAAMKAIEKAFKEQMDAPSREQKDMAKKASELIEELKAAKENFQKNEDIDNTRKVEESLKALMPPQPRTKPKGSEPKREDKQDNPIPMRMKDAANELKDKSEAPQKVLDEQKQITKELERALEALEGRPADVTKREIQKRRDAEKEIDKLSKELRQLQDESKKLDHVKDNEERLKKKREELAQKHAELQEKIQNVRRQLARLDEQHAVDNLNQADNKLDKAREQIQNGGNPQDAQNQAQQELNQAKEELKQAEEELARELLIKIADQLDGLKKRQDAQVVRSENLHEKVMKRKSWSEAFIDSLDGNADAQKTLADETDSFKEKLKEAKVFHSLLERAKDSMDKASESMLTRKTELAVERRYLDEGNGKKMDEREVADEVDAQNTTIKHQKQAARRLEILLDSIKDELAKKRKPRDPEAVKKDENQEKQQEQKKGGLQAQDGIPPVAQLKALKSEQLDLNQRTEDFNKRHPDADMLNEAQLNELHELEQEQERLQVLFGQLIVPPDAKEQGDQP